MSHNQELYDKASKAISDLFSDQSVDINTCRDHLENLQSDIEDMIDSLKGMEEND